MAFMMMMVMVMVKVTGKVMVMMMVKMTMMTRQAAPTSNLDLWLPTSSTGPNFLFFILKKICVVDDDDDHHHHRYHHHCQHLQLLSQLSQKMVTSAIPVGGFFLLFAVYKHTSIIIMCVDKSWLYTECSKWQFPQFWIIYPSISPTTLMASVWAGSLMFGFQIKQCTAKQLSPADVSHICFKWFLLLGLQSVLFYI